MTVDFSRSVAERIGPMPGDCATCMGMSPSGPARPIAPIPGWGTTGAMTSRAMNCAWCGGSSRRPPAAAQREAAGLSAISSGLQCRISCGLRDRRRAGRSYRADAPKPVIRRRPQVASLRRRESDVRPWLRSPRPRGQLESASAPAVAAVAQTAGAARISFAPRCGCGRPDRGCSSNQLSRQPVAAVAQTAGCSSHQLSRPARGCGRPDRGRQRASALAPSCGCGRPDRGLQRESALAPAVAAVAQTAGAAATRSHG